MQLTPEREREREGLWCEINSHNQDFEPSQLRLAKEVACKQEVFWREGKPLNLWAGAQPPACVWISWSWTCYTVIQHMLHHGRGASAEEWRDSQTLQHTHTHVPTHTQTQCFMQHWQHEKMASHVQYCDECLAAKVFHVQIKIKNINLLFDSMQRNTHVCILDPLLYLKYESDCRRGPVGSLSKGRKPVFWSDINHHSYLKKRCPQRIKQVLELRVNVLFFLHLHLLVCICLYFIGGNSHPQTP